jgi:hypothetical protein
MMSRRRSIVRRDQRASAFAAVLMRLCDAVFAVGAALVDAEGETVDYAGAIDPFDIKIAAAEWAIVLSALKGSRAPVLAATEELLVRAATKSYYVHLLGDGYALVLELPRRSFDVSRRAVAETLREIAAESGLPLPKAVVRDREHWSRVDVRCTKKHEGRRPTAIWMNGTWHEVEILGRWNGDARGREWGFRARLPNGAEITLVRERLGRWYVEGLIGASS